MCGLRSLLYPFFLFSMILVSGCLSPATYMATLQQSASSEHLCVDDLRDFFISNGYESLECVGSGIQAHWRKGPENTVLGRKAGAVNARVTLNDDRIIVYISESEKRIGQASITAHNLKVSLEHLYPGVSVTVLKSSLPDFDG